MVSKLKWNSKKDTIIKSLAKSKLTVLGSMVLQKH